MENQDATAIEKVPLPVDSLVAALPFRDYSDAFRARVDLDRFPDVDAFAQAFFIVSPPLWVSAAMKARDAVVGTLFGLKTSPTGSSLAVPRGGAPEFVAGARFGIFRFFERTACEIVLGEDDRHLDFRVSLFHHARADGNTAFVTMSTVVRFNNALGRAYFFPVRPVHGLIVPAMMRRVLAKPTSPRV